MVVGDSLDLNWTEATGADEYWNYGATNDPYFEPVLTGGFENRVAEVPAGASTWATDAGIADSTTNWTYLIVAVDSSDQEIARSNRIGEHDFDSAIR